PGRQTRSRPLPQSSQQHHLVAVDHGGARRIAQQRGDAVAIRSDAGETLAHGLAEYDALECARLMGHNSAEHAALLGYAPRSAVVHRDQMVLL
ncbi:MAG: hypothetical protein RL339_2205, partial [Pseudomonadota bacterium]